MEKNVTVLLRSNWVKKICRFRTVVVVSVLLLSVVFYLPVLSFVFSSSESSMDNVRGSIAGCYKPVDLSSFYFRPLDVNLENLESLTIVERGEALIFQYTWNNKKRYRYNESVIEVERDGKFFWDEGKLCWRNDYKDVEGLLPMWGRFIDEGYLYCDKSGSLHLENKENWGGLIFGIIPVKMNDEKSCMLETEKRVIAPR
jgi:hypothetical protein